jgi:hypothetical protein
MMLKAANNTEARRYYWGKGSAVINTEINLEGSTYAKYI